MRAEVLDYVAEQLGIAVRGLLDLAPDKATRLGEAGTEQVVDAAVLRVGCQVLPASLAEAVTSEGSSENRGLGGRGRWRWPGGSLAS